MNIITAKMTKNKIRKLINAGDIKSLKELIKNSDSEVLDIASDIFLDMFYEDMSSVLSIFDNNGKCIADHKKYLYKPSIMNIIVQSDPSIRKEYSELEEKLFDYYAREISAGRREDLLFSMGSVKEAISRDNSFLEELFDGKKLTKHTYDLVLKRLLTTYPNMNEFSELFKSNYTEFELALIRSMNNCHNPYSFEELVTLLNREDLNKCIKLKGRGSHVEPEIIISKESIPLMVYATSIKESIIDDYEPEVLKAKLGECLGEVQAKYFMLHDGTLDSMLNELKVPFDELDSYLYIKDDHVVFTPHFVSNLLENEDYANLFYILDKYFDKGKYDDIKIVDPSIKIDSLVKISSIYSSIKKIPHNDMAISFMLNNLQDNINILHLEASDLDRLQEVLLDLSSRIYNSNAPELKAFGGDILYQILSNGKDYDYKESIDKIEEIFNKNNLPVVAKKFLIFQILNPTLNKNNFNLEAMSPTLASVDGNEQFKIIFNDLMRITLGSNNLSMKKILENINYGNSIYMELLDKKISVEDLPLKDREILEEFLGHLSAIYNNTKAGKENNYNLTGDLEEDLNNLIPLFKPNGRYSLPDRIIRMYCYGAGFKSFQDVYDYMGKTISDANNRGRTLAATHFSLEIGDMVKGIGSESYLFDILQNGSLCKEFLGAHMSSDLTPLDTDLSMILEKGLSLTSTMSKTKADAYGPIYFVIKNGKFPMTRTKCGEEANFTTTGPECFVTLSNDHVGVRTGFASSDIDYIMVDQSDEVVSIDRIGFTMALNGIYTPVVDYKTGKLLFAPEQYDAIRKQMNGLSYYGIDKFDLSNNLEVPKDYDNKTLIDDAKAKREKLNNIVKDIVKREFNLDFKTKIDSDITTGSVEFIDTGSTGRGTNIDVNSDFDFAMRIDERLDRSALSKAVCNGLGINYEKALENDMVIGKNNLRLKDVKVPGIDTPIDIDITFLSKADQVVYSTDMAINDRLEVIKRAYPDKYEKVLDNIIYAKEYLKANKIYKARQTRDNSQGGLGGVGIENWILQNGGSFHDACQSFYDMATEHGMMVNFDKFSKKYKVYNFGVNFYSNDYGEFISQNMTSDGYKKMYKAVSAYLVEYRRNHPDEKKTSGPNFADEMDVVNQENVIRRNSR